MVINYGESSCFKKAMNKQDSKKWYKDMSLDMESFEKNGTSDLVQLPKQQKTLPCKWVYKMKVTSTSKQAWLRGEPSMNMELILTTLRTILGLVTIEDMEFIHMDKKTAFYMAICMKT
mgnify:CR=1 FL=1